MPDTQQTEKTVASLLTLEGCQDVRVAADLQRRLIEVLSRGTPVSVECSQIDTLDASTIQLLLAAKRESNEALAIEASPESESAIWFRQAGVAERLLTQRV